MKIDRGVLELLKTYFVSRRGTTHIAGDVLPGGTDSFKLGAPTNRWDTIYARQVIADSLTGGAGASNADTVDGFHASSVSTADTLLPLDAGQKYPITAYPSALLIDGSRSLTGNMAVGAGVTVDGIDISAHAIDSSHHVSGMFADDHTQYMHISSQRVVSAVHTFNPGVVTPFIVLGANAQDQLISGLYVSRAVDLDRSVIAGTALTGGGILTADRTLNANPGWNINTTDDAINLDTPGTLDINSTNQVTTAHTHAITASYNPGASAALLQTSGAGELFLIGDFGVDTDTLYVDVSENAVYINAGTLPTRRGALTVHPDNVNQRGLVLEQLSGQVSNLFTVFDSSGGDLIVLTNAGDLESGDPNFVSGLTGWQITSTGDAEFWNATIRGELHASVFVADEMHATGGTLAVMTVGKVADPGSSGDNEMGAIGANFDLRMQASWDTGLCYFADDDVIRIKFMGDDGGGLDLWDVYVQLMASPGSVIGRDLAEGEPGYHILDVRRRDGGATGLPIPTGTGGVKWGNRTGSGYSGGMILTTDLSYSPYLDIFTIDNSVTYDPWEAGAILPRARIGNLGGVLGGSVDEWGIAFGKNLADVSLPYAIFSDLRASLHGIKQDWWDLSGNIRGQIDPDATGPDTMFWLGTSSADPKFEVTGDGLVRMSGAFIGPTGGVLVDDGIVWLPFDGDKRFGGIETLSPIDWMIPTSATGSIYSGWGKYGSGLVVGDGGTNLIENPSFQNNISDGWTSNGVGTHVQDTSQANHHTGSGSLRITAGASTAQRFTATDSLPAGWTVWGYAWIKVAAGGSSGDGQVVLYDSSTPATRGVGQTVRTDGEWELVLTYWTNTTGLARNIRFYLENRATDSSTVVWYDQCQMTFSSNPAPYIDGDKPGNYWVGTAHNSHSVRTVPKLTYSVTIPSTWTISFWWAPTARASDISGVSARIFEWYGDGDDRIIFYQPAGLSEMRIYHQVAGNLAYDDANFTPFGRGVSYHILATYDGSGFQWWINNIDHGYTTHSQSWGTTPNTLAIGSNFAGGERAQGVVSDLFILNKAVDAAFVEAVYNGTVPAAISNDLFFKVFDPETGSTTITPKAVMIRGSANAMGISTNPDPMVIGGITVNSGDVVLGENRVGSSAIHWDGYNGTFNFYSDGSVDEDMRWDYEGMVFRVTTTETLESSIKWIRDDYPDEPFGQISLWNDGIDESWMKVKNNAPPGHQAWSQIQAWGTSAYLDLQSVGGLGGTTLTLFEGPTDRYLWTSARVSTSKGFVSGGDTVADPGVGNVMYYGSLLSNKAGTNRTVYGSHFFVTRVLAWNSVVRSSSGPTLITHTTLGIPDNCKAVLVRIVALDSGSWPQDLYAAVGPASGDPFAVACYPQGVASGPKTLVASNTGWTPCTAGGDIYFRNTASGVNTMTIWIYVYGYAI